MNKKDIINKILKLAPEDFEEEETPSLQDEVLADIIGSKLDNFNMGYNKCNEKWRNIINNI